VVSHTPPLRTRPLALLDVLAGDAEYIRIEVPGDAGRGAEFVLMRDGVREWHQAKRQRTEGPWTITSLNSTGVLAPWWSKLQVGDRCVFVSGTSAQQLYELAERATMAESWTEFDQEFLGARDQRANFELLSKAWGVAPGEAVFLALRKVSAYAIDEKQLKERVRDRAAVLLNGDPAAVARHLAEIADDSVHRRVTAPDILESLAGSGYARIRADVGQGRERDAPGTRQAIRNSAGANVYVSGYRHKVSVHTGPRWPLGGRPRLLAGLLVVFIAAVTAVYLVSRSSGIPEYFNTGPGAGLYLPPSTQSCGNITPDPLISPAGNELTDVSEAKTVSLDGRTAFLMQGDFNGTTYYWVVSVPNGKYGGIQLRWWLNGQRIHSCTVSLNDAPPAALAQQGIRLLSSMAVPSIINGDPVNFQACAWYTVQRKVHQLCT
jgi:hypothetical protein